MIYPSDEEIHGLESWQFWFGIPIWKQTCTLFFNLGQVSWAMHGILSFVMHGPGRCWVTHFSTWPILRTTAVLQRGCSIHSLSPNYSHPPFHAWLWGKWLGRLEKCIADCLLKSARLLAASRMRQYTVVNYTKKLWLLATNPFTAVSKKSTYRTLTNKWNEKGILSNRK